MSTFASCQKLKADYLLLTKLAPKTIMATSEVSLWLHTIYSNMNYL